MFIVQRVVRNTVSQVLSRFIKGGEENIYFDECENGNLLHLRDLNFREDTLDMLMMPLTQGKVSVEKATMGSFRANVSWTGGTLYWNDIYVKVRLPTDFVAPKRPPSPQHTQSVVEEEPHSEDTPMGWSLRSYSTEDLLGSEELMTSLRNSFSSPILGVQKKFDEIADSLVHEFNNVEIVWDSWKAQFNGNYSKKQGVLLETLYVSYESNCVFKTGGIYIPGLSDFDLIQVESVELIVLSEVITFVMSFIKTPGRIDPKVASSPKTKWGVAIGQLTVKAPDIAKFSAHELVVSSDTGRLTCSSLTFSDDADHTHEIRITDVIVDMVDNNNDDDDTTLIEKDEEKTDQFLEKSGKETTVNASSPFEEDRLYLFRTEETARPIGDRRKTDRYKQQQKRLGKGHVNFKGGVVSTGDNGFPLNNLKGIAASLQQLLLATNITAAAENDRGGGDWSIEVTVDTADNVRFEPLVPLRVQGLNLFKGCGEFWSLSSDEIELQGYTMVRDIRLAGEDLRRISVDVSAGLVENLDAILTIVPELLPDVEEEEPAVDLCIRVKQAKLRANSFFCRDVRLTNLEVFTFLGGGDRLIITAGRVESKSSSHTSRGYGIKGTGLQISLGSQKSVNIASVTGMASNEDLRDIITALKLKIAKKENKGEDADDNNDFDLTQHEMVKNYLHSDLGVSSSFEASRSDQQIVQQQRRQALWKVTIRQLKLKLFVVDKTPGHIEIHLDSLKYRYFKDGLSKVSLLRAECLDRIEESVWNKAVIIRGMHFETQMGNITATVGEDVSKKTHHSHNHRKEDVTLTLDQCVIDYVVQFIASLQPAKSETTITNDDASATAVDSSIWLKMIRVAPFKARIDYKPTRDPKHPTPMYLRFLPLRSAVLKVENFDAFDVSGPGEVAMKFALHALTGDTNNLGRIIAGYKPIRTPANVFRNATELLLVPLTTTGSGGDSAENVQDIIDQARRAATQTAISVLELGPALNVRPVDYDSAISIHSQQPSSVKEGLVRAGQTFKKDMTTIIAFITGDRRSVDIFDLPVMVLRPFTAPLSDILNGMCNQLDRERYERLRDKYG